MNTLTRHRIWFTLAALAVVGALVLGVSQYASRLGVNLLSPAQITGSIDRHLFPEEANTVTVSVRTADGRTIPLSASLTLPASPDPSVAPLPSVIPSPTPGATASPPPATSPTPSPASSPLPPTTGRFEHPRSIAPEGPVGATLDANKDGHVDLALADSTNGLTLYTNNGHGLFNATALATLPNVIRHMEIGDVGADNDQDIVVSYVHSMGDSVAAAFAWYENSGGQFTQRLLFIPNTDKSCCSLGTNYFFRLTGNQPDLLANLRGRATLVRNPWRGFQSTTLAPLTLANGGGVFGNISDIPLRFTNFIYITAGTALPELRSFDSHGIGAPTPTKGDTTLIANHVNASVTTFGDPPLRIVDINNDSRPDILTAVASPNGRTAQLTWWSGTDLTSHTIPVQLSRPTPHDGGAHTWFDTGDLDADGDLDIVVYALSPDSLDRLSWLESTNDTWTPHTIDENANMKGSGVLVRQLNNDQKPDIVLLGWPARIYFQK